MKSMTAEQRNHMLLCDPVSSVIPKMAVPTIISMLITNIYNMADTFFVSQIGTSASGAVGVIFSAMAIIQAISFMIGMGSGTHVSQALGAGNKKKADTYASTAFFTAFIAGIILAFFSLTHIDFIVRFLGSTETIAPYAKDYATYIFYAMPFMMCSFVMNNLLRFEGLTMYGMVGITTGGILNMVLDPILIFALNMGTAGAALATAVSPVLSIAICSRHFFKKSSTVHLVRQLPSPKLLAQSCQLGVSGFVGEMSSGVTTTVFNLLLLRLAGNVAVAAYGVVANYALVATAIFNGVAQGAQPLVSRCYGKNDAAGTRKLLLLGSGTALALAAALYAVLFGFTGPIVAVFNSENSALMTQYAFSGMRIYFLGYFFAGFNIVAAGYLGAVDRPAEASATSLSRGIVAIVACSLVLSALFGMNGVWAAFPASEAITACLTLFLLKRKKRTK